MKIPYASKLRMKIFPLILGFAFLVVNLASTMAPAFAADASLFNAGRIIDDQIFTNNNSMSVGQIQAFLNEKNSVCLKNFSTLSLTDDNNNGWVEDTGAEPYGLHGNVSAAQLIKSAADIYKINPQVILVTLQKEQGLITRSDCPDWRYNTALGYGCPDTAPCSQAAYGFTRQIDYGVYHLRGFYDDTLSFVPFGVGNYRISYDTDASCGSSTVNIQNRATASLYSYTPYQPSSAALAAGYGLAEPCGAYGNRNFYLYFNDWFGPTLISAFKWEYTSQEIYTDATASQTVGYNNILAGNRYYFRLQVKNTGSAIWQNGQIRVAPTEPQDRTSALYDPTWISPSRAVTHDQVSVAPGETATFSFWGNAPSSPGVYKERFNLLAEGVTWMNDNGLYWLLSAQPPTYKWGYVDQAAYTDDTKATPANLWDAAPNQRYYVTLQAKNTGNMSWNSSWTRIATSGPQDRNSASYDSSWTSSNRAAALQQTSVAPGETGTFSFWIKTPSSGMSKEYFNLVAEGRVWMNNNGLYWLVNVPPPNYTWQWMGQAAYTDASKTTPANLLNATAGQRYYLTVDAKNIGNRPWNKAQTRLATSQPQDRTSAVFDPTWLNQNRAASLDQAIVAPGETGTFSFWITVPSSGVYKEYFNLVSESTSWMNNNGLYWLVSAH